MQANAARWLFYLFLGANLVALVYWYYLPDAPSVADIQTYLAKDNFYISYGLFIAILTVRGLTILPGGIFLLAGVFLFSFWQVFMAMQVAIFFYCIIIHRFAHHLNFNIPQKILNFEQKLAHKRIPIIFSLCFIPGISINILAYFLTIINVKLRYILVGIMLGTMITSNIYIAILEGIAFSTEKLL